MTDNEKGHYLYITKYDNLCKKANSNSTVYVCRKCCWVFYHQKELDEHYEKDDCRSVALNFVPVDKKYIQFEKHNNKFRLPFVIYADFECLLNNIHENEHASRKYQTHTPCSYAYKICCSQLRN